MRRGVIAVVAALALTSASFASTIVVDQFGGGTAFTDIPPAIAAAQPLDVILVHPGSYSGFALSANISVVGTGPNVFVASGTRIHAVASGSRTVLANMRLVDLRINDCAGAVILDGLVIAPGSATPYAQSLTVENCVDVRAIRCDLGGTTPSAPSSRRAVSASASRLELVQCTLTGDAGPSTQCGAGGPGGDALIAHNASRVHLSSTHARGGAGGGVNYVCGEFCNLGAGDGGNAVALFGSSQLVAMGRATNLLQGGTVGDGSDCACDGDPGRGIYSFGSSATWSGCTPVGGNGICFTSGRATGAGGGGTVTQAPALAPFLERNGTLTPGQLVQFDVTGLPGDAVELRVGRGPALTPLVGVEIEELTTVLRVFQLGTIGASGVVSISLLPAAWLPQGFDFYTQAVIVRGGTELRTNSVPVVLR